MESVKDVLSNAPQFFRFGVFQAKDNAAGKPERTKTVGMAYLKAGSNIYTLRLWTLLNERFYLVTRRNDPEAFLIMTREPNRGQWSKNKYFWNIVGSGRADTEKGVIVLEFDLFERPIYMNLFPERSATSAAMSDPLDVDVPDLVA